MIGQLFAFRTSIVGLGDDDRTALPDAGNVAVEILKCERELIGIQAFGATPELRPLQLVDDGLEAFDLTIAAVDDNSISRTRRCNSAVSDGRFSRSNRIFDSTQTC
jgi:hypothetical protein